MNCTLRKIYFVAQFFIDNQAFKLVKLRIWADGAQNCLNRGLIGLCTFAEKAMAHKEGFHGLCCGNPEMGLQFLTLGIAT